MMKPLGGLLSCDALSVLALMRTPYWVFDPELSRMRWANAAGLAFWHSPGLDELLSRDYGDMFEGARSRMKSAAIVSEQWTLRPNGKPVKVWVTCVGIRLEDGVLASLQEAVVVSEVDSETLPGEDTIHNTKVAVGLREALAAEKRFLATMSHEIRTPLSSVVGFIDLLRTTVLSEKQKTYLDHAHVSARLLLDLISDSLDVSKLDAGQVELGKEDFDLEDVVLECLVVASSRLSKGVDVLYHVPELETLVVGDPTRLKQIVVNLLGNAAKFTEKGHITLSLTTRPSAREGFLDVEIEVEDTGIGIPESKAAGLFAPYRQAHEARYGGSGLGLHLSRSLARLMGGDVTLRATSQSGSTFAVALRLQRGPVKTLKYSLESAATLLLTNDAPLREMMAKGFKNAGANVRALATGFNTSDVLRTLLTHPRLPELVVIDTEAFHGASTALARVIREMDSKTLVIGLTNEQDRARDDAFHLRMDKPFTFCKLLRSIHELRESSGSASCLERIRAMRVLLVEDVEANVTLAVELFRIHFGIDLSVARDGTEAVSATLETRYDLVLMDLQMPRMNGLEATRRIRARGDNVPIVAMTADALSDQVQNAFDAGMVGYITKSVRRVILEQVLVKHARKQANATPSVIPRISVRPESESALSSDECQQQCVAVPVCARDVGVEYQQIAHGYFASLLAPDQAPRLVRSSMKSVASLLRELTHAQHRGDREVLRRTLHALKGVLRNSGLDAPAEVAEELEADCESDCDLSTRAGAIEALCVDMTSFTHASVP